MCFNFSVSAEGQAMLQVCTLHHPTPPHPNPVFCWTDGVERVEPQVEDTVLVLDAVVELQVDRDDDEVDVVLERNSLARCPHRHVGPLF